MDLILLRHGKAENFNPGGDSERALVEKGREQVRRAARLLKAGGVLPDIVLTSPYVRARQTADEFCTMAGLPGPVTMGWLASGMVPETALTEISTFKDFQRVAIVGHEPDLSQLLRTILGANSGGVEMKKGAVACVQISPPTWHGTLLYLIPPKLAVDPGA